MVNAAQAVAGDAEKEHYIRVVTRSHENLSNRIVPTYLIEPIQDGARGELAQTQILNFEF